MIVFLGSNPSNSSISCDPFSGETRSGKILAAWIAHLNIESDDYVLMNVSNAKTPNNKRLSKAEIINQMPFLRPALRGKFVVALGASAEMACNLLTEYSFGNFEYYPFHHPSGLNRKLNDKVAIKKDLDLLKNEIDQLYIRELMSIISMLG